MTTKKRTINYLREKIEDTKGSEGQKKRTNYDLENTTQTTKDSATRAPLKLGENSGVPVSLVTPVMLLLNDTNIMFETTIRI